MIETRSLKSVLESLAPMMGTSLDVLYEHQRQLVREGVLHPRPGHGRNSGVLATSETVAIFFVTFMARKNAREVIAFEDAAVRYMQDSKWQL